MGLNAWHYGQAHTSVAPSPLLKSPAERRLTRCHRDRVLPPAGPPPPPCASLPDPLCLIHLAPRTGPPPLLPCRAALKAPSAIAARSFPPPPLLPSPHREHLLAPLTSFLKPTTGARWDRSHCCCDLCTLILNS
jgi:hypothetical protein